MIYSLFLYALGVVPVRWRKNLMNVEGVEKLSRSAIWAMVRSVCKSICLALNIVIREIHSFAGVFVTWDTTEDRYLGLTHSFEA